MAGLARLCRLHGQLQVGKVLWVWDYAQEKPVIEADMPKGSERWKLSEKAKKVNYDRS